MKALIAILVIIAVGVGGYLFLSPTWQNPEPNNPSENTSPAGPQTYNSDANGIMFQYPGGYQLQEREDGFENEDIKVITLMESDVVIPDMSEGPPVISILIIPNADEMALEDWIKEKSISNFNLSTNEQLSSTTVSGKAALSYTHSGLYESDAVAVEHEGKIYLFSVGWHDASSHMRTDFQNLLKSVQLK